MMFLSLLLTLTGGLVLAVPLIVVGKIVQDRWALVRLKKLSRGLPIAPGAHLAGNHSIALMLSQNNCWKAMELHDKLGETFGFVRGSDFAASTTDLDLIKRFIHDEQSLHLVRTHFNIPAIEFEESILCAPMDEWRQVRKALAPAFTIKKVRSPNVVAEIQSSVDKLVGHIERKLVGTEPGEFVADELAHKYSLDLVFRCFYKQSDLVDFDDPNDNWTRVVEASLDMVRMKAFVALAIVFPIFRHVLDWLMINWTEPGRARTSVQGFIRDQTKLGIQARLEATKLQRDASEAGTAFDSQNFVLADGRRFRRNMIDHIVDQFLDGNLTRDQYMNNSSFLLAAADKTSASSIVHTLFLLSTHPAVQERLRRSVQEEGLESEYLEWVLKESLRLLPTAPVGCSRTIQRAIETKEGHILPAKTFVMCNAFVIHRLKKYWGEDADRFKPERWRDTSHHHPLQYMPFGAGRRGCLGQKFAMFEMKMLFVELLRRYRFQAEPSNHLYDFHAAMLVMYAPLKKTRIAINRL